MRRHNKLVISQPGSISKCKGGPRWQGMAECDFSGCSEAQIFELAFSSAWITEQGMWRKGKKRSWGDLKSMRVIKFSALKSLRVASRETQLRNALAAATSAVEERAALKAAGIVTRF